MVMVMIYYYDCVFPYGPPIPKCLLSKKGQRRIPICVLSVQNGVLSQEQFCNAREGRVGDAGTFLVVAVGGGVTGM